MGLEVRGMVWYTTREAVKASMDMKETSRSNTLVDQAIAAASDGIEGTCLLRFYPEIDTRSFDWPNGQYARNYRFWLGRNEVISLDRVVSGTRVIDPADYELRRADDLNEPPYDHLELKLSTSAAFDGTPSHQKSLVLSGTFGYSDTFLPTTATTALGNATVNTVDIADASQVGVGSLVSIGAEWLIVTEKYMIATSDTASAAQAPAAQLIPVVSGAAYAIGEVILLDAERMRVDDIAGNNLIVRRAWDGSTLAAHTTATIYAQRRLKVRRGQLGTSAAAFDSAAPVGLWEVPDLIGQWCKGEAINDLLQGNSGYAREVGSGENSREMNGRALRDIRDRATTRYGRVGRTAAV